ncbi:ligase [Aureococcus anophagefferens]|nr:ligase [Aureococcus anophagefferens]
MAEFLGTPEGRRPRRCVFAPLNPQLTAPEIEFELEDLPAHAMILMEARLPAQKGNAL